MNENTKDNIFKIGIILILAIFFLFVYNNFIFPKLEHMCDSCLEPMTTTTATIHPLSHLKWARNECKYEVNSTLKKVLNDKNIKEVRMEEADILIPCTYDNTEKEIENLKVVKDKDQKYFVFDNVDTMVAKDDLWDNIVDYYGYNKAITMMPISYNLNNSKDLEKLKNDFHKDKLYIIKQNIQRQEGIKITNSLDELLSAKDKEFVVAQELLQNPYIINKRKTNMRFYVLITCKNNNMTVYVFNDGFMYYTKDEFKKNSLQIGHNITTGYIDRWVYSVNPLTHTDLREYLDKERELTEQEKKLKLRGFKLSSIFFNRIHLLLKNIFLSFIL